MKEYTRRAPPSPTPTLPRPSLMGPSPSLMGTSLMGPSPGPMGPAPIGPAPLGGTVPPLHNTVTIVQQPTGQSLYVQQQIFTPSSYIPPVTMTTTVEPYAPLQPPTLQVHTHTHIVTTHTHSHSHTHTHTTRTHSHTHTHAHTWLISLLFVSRFPPPLNLQLPLHCFLSYQPPATPLSQTPPTQV